jgi:hypothetical protein
VTSRSIGLTWQPPANARNLGSDLLGYRIYVTERKCDGDKKIGDNNRVGSNMRRCRKITPITINSGRTMRATVRGLGE